MCMPAITEHFSELAVVQIASACIANSVFLLVGEREWWILLPPVRSYFWSQETDFISAGQKLIGGDQASVLGPSQCICEPEFN